MSLLGSTDVWSAGGFFSGLFPAGLAQLRWCQAKIMQPMRIPCSSFHNSVSPRISVQLGHEADMEIHGAVLKEAAATQR